MKLNGVYTALVTPFENNALDTLRFRGLCKRQIDAGVAGLVPCGTTGETPALTPNEWRQTIEIAVEVARGSVPVIAGCGTNNTETTKNNVRIAKEIGADDR